jgi:hypothetical protein
MIGIGFKVQVKKTRAISDAGRVLSLPLLEMTQRLVNRMMARVAQGLGPDGPWSTYGTGQGDADPNNFWVSPGRPQPTGDGLLRKIEQGKWAGWALYRSVRAYYDLRGLTGQPHDYDETGLLRSLLAVRIMSPRHIRTAFYGRHRNLPAKVVAKLASQRERVSILTPSRSEIQEAQAFIVEHLNEAVMNAARNVESAQRITSKARSLNKRTSRLLGD